MAVILSLTSVTTPAGPWDSISKWILHVCQDILSTWFVSVMKSKANLQLEASVKSSFCPKPPFLFQQAQITKKIQLNSILTLGFTPNSMGGTGSTESTWISTPLTGGIFPSSRSVPSEPFLFFRERSLPIGPGLCSLFCPEPWSESLTGKQRGWDTKTE